MPLKLDENERRIILIKNSAGQWIETKLKFDKTGYTYEDLYKQNEATFS